MKKAWVKDANPGVDKNVGMGWCVKKKTSEDMNAPQHVSTNYYT